MLDDKETCSFQKVPRKSFAILHCSCSDEEKAPFGNEVYVRVFENGEVELECTECGETYAISEVVNKANEVY